MIQKIQDNFYIIPLIVGVMFLILAGQFITAVGFFIIAWSKSVEAMYDNETGIIKSMVVGLIGLILVIFGLIF